MKIQLNTKYKSLLPFEETDLPTLTVLTGVNGRGKTQLLESIAGSIANVWNTPTYIGENMLLLYLTLGTLTPHEHNINPTDYNTRVKNLIGNLRSILKNSPNITADEILRTYPGQTELTFLKQILELSGKTELKYLDEIDIETYFPIDIGDDYSNMFTNNLAGVFGRYKTKFDNNELKQFRSVWKKIEGQKFFTDEEFVKIHGPAPWIFMNEILETTGMGFTVQIPDQKDKEPIVIRLRRNTGEEINFGELSSGEKVIMTLSLSIYNARRLRTFPKLILMDEPDATLHPSLIKVFLRVIREILIEQYGMHVVFSTHSPTTIALCPEESIYLIDNTKTPLINKISRDQALNSLLSGVSSVSVVYENRRQVFVESKNDVSYYESILKIIKSNINPEITFTFISSGDAKTYSYGSCDQVYKITKLLTEGGNKFVKGIVDWDLKNVAKDEVYVLGEGKRYSIENFIFDPILMSIYLTQKDELKIDDLDLPKNFKYHQLSSLEQSQIQLIVNRYLENFVFDASKRVSYLPCTYTGGLIINLPDWFLFMQGHLLEDAIKSKWPSLNRHSKEDSLKLEIIKEVMSNFPQFIPNELLDLFIALQK